jgi:Zn-dependent M28 family amino/carboxypeptidase
VRTNSNLAKLLPCVTLDGVRAHQAALQAIADANGGTRAAGTPGAAASVAYVVSVMEAAGYLVTQQSFDFVYRAAPTLQQIAPFSATYATGTYAGSGSGSATAAVAAVDLQLGIGNTSTSGCDAADFAGFPAGAIALIQRGFCTFSVKASNAQAAGAVAVIIFNQGNSTAADRQGLIVGTLNPFAAGIPVVGASYADGVSLTAPGSTATVIVPAPINVPQVNVLAESRSGDPDNVVVVGGHLDSVLQGPGIQDNGSGTAAILETAVQMARVKPRNQVRFAFWAAEESGLIGSWAYLDGLSWEERNRIALYLNFDMIGSPNHVFFIYDGDDSDGVGAGPGPFGSAAIEKVFEAFYLERGLPFKGTDFSGRSDYGPFIAYGIPAGGLLTGAEGLKSPAEAALWGGVAGSPYDPCYHLACDTFDNVNLSALDTNAGAVAYATLSFAQSTASVNGNAGKGNFRQRTTPSARTAQEALPSN